MLGSIYLCRIPKWSPYTIRFFVFRTMPGKLFSSVADPTSSAEGKSTYKMFVLAGKSACKLKQKEKVVDYQSYATIGT